MREGRHHLAGHGIIMTRHGTQEFCTESEAGRRLTDGWRGGTTAGGEERLVGSVQTSNGSSRPSTAGSKPHAQVEFRESVRFHFQLTRLGMHTGSVRLRVTACR